VQFDFLPTADHNPHDILTVVRHTDSTDNLVDEELAAADLQRKELSGPVAGSSKHNDEYDDGNDTDSVASDNSLAANLEYQNKRVARTQTTI